MSVSRNLALLFMFLSIMTVSGCVIPGINPTLSGLGVEIVEWKPDFSRVYSGEKVTFYSKVKNSGSFIANNINLQVLGLESWSNKAVSDMRCESGNIELVAPNPQYGTEGEEMVCAWTATAPDISPGLHMIYNPKVMVCYNYVSRTVLRTFSISRQELKRLQDAGAGLPSQGMISGSSPVTISASTISPIIMTEKDVTFPVKISVDDGGGGIVCMPDSDKACTDSGKINKVKIEIKSATASVAESECVGELTLLRRHGEVTCKLKMDVKTPTILQNDIGITASYRYCKESTTSIEVAGK
jgi:hypothetical protein